MFTEEQIDQLQKLFELNNEKLSTELRTKLKQELKIEFRKELKKELKKFEEKLTEKIDLSQKDTIEVLTALIHSGYNLHEVRISRLEEKLNLSPIKQ